MKREKEDDLVLRPADTADMELLFRWANDDQVRENAFHKEKISLEEHRTWFLNLLEDENQYQYILLHGSEPVGQIRLSVCEGKAEIDYSVVPEKRKQGYGGMLIELMQKKVRDEFPDIKKLTAKVKPSNMASVYCFEKKGFHEVYRQYELDLTNN